MPQTSPNMGLPVPTVSVDPGPAWAQEVDACFTAIDAHNHSVGQGVQINPSGININSTFSLNGNDCTQFRTARFNSQTGVLSLSSDLSCLYVVGTDLYFNDGSGNHVRMTQGGSVSGSAGTITGLPSGTASAAFAGGTFTFQVATNTPASMSFGPVSVGNSTANSKTVTIAPASGIASNWSLTLPAAPPASTQSIGLDSAGNVTFQPPGTMPVGSIVPVMANITGAYAPPTTGVVSNGWMLCDGAAIPAGQALSGNTPNLIGQFLKGATAAGAQAASSVSVSGNVVMPSHAHYLNSSGGAAILTSDLGPFYLGTTEAGPTFTCNLRFGVDSATSLSPSSAASTPLVGETGVPDSSYTTFATLTGTGTPANTAVVYLIRVA